MKDREGCYLWRYLNGHAKSSAQESPAGFKFKVWHQWRCWKVAYKRSSLWIFIKWIGFYSVKKIKIIKIILYFLKCIKYVWMLRQHSVTQTPFSIQSRLCIWLWLSFWGNLNKRNEPWIRNEPFILSLSSKARSSQDSRCNNQMEWKKFWSTQISSYVLEYNNEFELCNKMNFNKKIFSLSNQSVFIQFGKFEIMILYYFKCIKFSGRIHINQKRSISDNVEVH